MRVLITADTSSDVQVSTAAGLTVRDLGDRQDLPAAHDRGATRWRLNVDGTARPSWAT